MLNLSLKTSHKESVISELMLSENYLYSENSKQILCLNLLPKEKKKAIDRIHNILVSLAQNNCENDSFWYTPVSEMQPFISCVYRALESYAYLHANINKLNGKMVYVEPNIYLLNFIRKSFSKHISLFNSIKIFFRHTWHLMKCSLLRYVNMVPWLTKNIYNVLSSKSINVLPTHLDFLLISRFEQTQEKDIPETEWIDSYLGSLPDILSKSSHIAIIGRCGGSPQKLSQVLSEFSSFPIWTIYQYLSLKDLLWIIWRTFKFRLKTDLITDKPLSSLVYLESRNHCQAIADCLLVERSLENLLKRITVKKIIMMQENCAWETAVVIAARKVSPKPLIFGYFHCPVLPSSFRYRINSILLRYKPLPNKIITLGENMSKAMKKLGEWDELLINGYAFKTPLAGISIAKKIDKSTTEHNKILVLLGGNYDNKKFLQWLNAALNKDLFRNLQCLVKGHPRIPAKEILEKANIVYGSDTLFKPLDTHISFSEILADVECVVFKGTTAGIVGLAAGLPTIHICHEGIASDNALFDADQLCVSVRTSEALRRELLKIMSGITLTKNAHEYAFSYYDQSDYARDRTIDFLKH